MVSAATSFFSPSFTHNSEVRFFARDSLALTAVGPASAASKQAPSSMPIAMRRQRRDQRALPYERPDQATTETVSATTETVSARHRGITLSPAAPLGQRPKRVSFHGAVMTVLDQASGRQICEVEQELRDGHGGRYYPTSATQRSLGRELTKVSPKRKAQHISSFCGCTGGCSATCACCTDDIGCWWESWLDEASGKEVGWGCGCGGACTSALPAHVYSESEGSKARRAKLQEWYGGRGDVEAVVSGGSGAVPCVESGPWCEVSSLQK